MSDEFSQISNLIHGSRLMRKREITLHSIMMAVCLCMVASSTAVVAQVVKGQVESSSPQYYQFDPTSGDIAGWYSATGNGSVAPIATGSTGGPLLPYAYVYVIFWGSYWTSNPAQVSKLVSDFKSIINSPFVDGLHQYGVYSTYFGGYGIYGSNTKVSIADPPVSLDASASSTSTLISQSLTALFKQAPLPGGGNSGLPGYSAIYLFILPPTTKDPGPDQGAHSSTFLPSNLLGSVTPVANISQQVLTAAERSNGNKSGNFVADAWIDYGPEAQMTAAFGHELAEAMTDPIPGIQYNWQEGPIVVNGMTETSELCDRATLAEDFGTLNGVTVGACWSNALNGAAISLGSASNIGGNGMTSYYDPLDNSIHTFYLSADGHIHELYWNVDKWSSRDLLIQPFAGNPLSATANTSLASWWDPINNIGDVTYIDLNGHVQLLYYISSGSTNASWGLGWHGGDISALAGQYGQCCPVVPSDRLPQGAWALTAFEDGTGVPNVVYRTEGGDLWDLTIINGAWKADEMGASLGNSQLTSIYDGDVGHVFYIQAGTNHVMEMYLSGGPGSAWWSTDWSLMSNAASATMVPATDAITSVAEPSQQGMHVRHVFYVASSGHIIQITQKSSGFGNYWFSEDITAADTTNTQLAASYLGSPVGLASYIDNQSQIHVVYTGTDARIHDLKRISAWGSSFSYADTWSHDDPSSITGAPTSNLSRALTAAYNPNLAGQDIFYIQFGMNGSYSIGDVNELWNFNNSGWGRNVPTSAANSNGPSAVP